MIIGIDASRANHEQKTGVEWYAYFLIEEMKKNVFLQSQIQQHGVQVVLYSDQPLHGDLAKLPNGWTSKVLRWPPKRLWTQLRLSSEMLLHRPDVLFIPAHVPPIIHPKKTVLTIHDIAALRFPQGYQWFERWYSLWVVRHAIKRGLSLIVPSRFTKQEVQNYVHNTSAQITVIPHGVDDRYAIRQEKQLAAFGVHQPYLLFVGRLEEKKNTWRLIKAFDLLRAQESTPYQLVLIGKPGYGYEQVAQAIAESPYTHDIIVPGWVASDHLPALMQQASLFVFPSMYEGFGIPLLEAFAAQVAVAAASGSCLEEVGGDAARYADPQSIEDIAATIQQVLHNPALQQQLIQKGKKRVAEFSWKKTAEETIHMLISA